MKTFKLNLLVIGIALINMNANAQNSNQSRKDGKPPSVDEFFSQLDQNQDNQLSVDEVEGPLKKDFSDIDVNGNGFISFDELSDAPKPQRKRGKRPRR